MQVYAMNKEMFELSESDHMNQNHSVADSADVPMPEYPLNLILSLKKENVKDFAFPDEITDDIMAGFTYVISTLPERQREIISMRYEKHMTYTEIGRYFGVSYSRIRQLEHKAFSELYHPKRYRFIRYGLNGYLAQSAKLEYDKGVRVGYEEGYRKAVQDLQQSRVENGLTINISDIRLENLNFSVRTFQNLQKAGYEKVGDIVGLTLEQILDIRYIGQKSKEEIANRLVSLGVNRTEWDRFIAGQ